MRAAMSDGNLTREQALLMLNDHIGEQVYCGLRVSIDATDDMPAGSHGVIELHGLLAHTVGPQTEGPLPDDTTREIFGYLYKVDEQPVSLPPLPGTISYNGNGLDFALADGLTLRIAWTAPEGDA